MPVANSFNQFPADFKVPFFYAEIDPSGAGNQIDDLRSLIIGYGLSDNPDLLNRPVKVFSNKGVEEAFGAGSMVAMQHRAFNKVDNLNERLILALAPPSEGNQASGTLRIAAPPSSSGAIYVYIGGEAVPIGVSSGDTPASVAGKIVAGINSRNDLPVNAASADEVVTLQVKWKGENGNDIPISVNWLGQDGGQVKPAGLQITVEPMSGGTGLPNLEEALANLGDEAFEYYNLGFTDTQSLPAFQEFIGLETGRWSPTQQLYGGGFAAKIGSVGELSTFGEGRNDPFLSVLGVTGSQMTPWEIGAAYTARAGIYLRNDPARPLNTGPLNGVLAPKVEDRHTLQEKNVLLGDGISTVDIGNDGTMRITRAVTQYRENALGSRDDAFLDVTTSFTLSRIIRRLRGRIEREFPRHKLANDGTRFSAGQNVVTPSIAKATILSEAALLEEEGLLENYEALRDALIVERNLNEPTRLDVKFPPDLVNPLHIFAVLTQFRLQTES